MCTAVIKISDGVSLSEVQTVHIFTFARYICTIYEIVLMQTIDHCGVSLIEYVNLNWDAYIFLPLLHTIASRWKKSLGLFDKKCKSCGAAAVFI